LFQSNEVPVDPLPSCFVLKSRTVGLREYFEGLLDFQFSDALVLLVMLSGEVSGNVPVCVRGSAGDALLEFGR